jgi:DNA-binding Lrp family transcriptional regulator
MNEILEILEKDAHRSIEDIAKMTGKKSDAVKKVIKKFEKDGVIVGYKTVINYDLLESEKKKVRALIEVSITPQKNVGFDLVAERIYQFPEVISCYLVSGRYDLLVVVEGEDIQAVAGFIASKLSSMQGVRSTTTHFLLKKYKEEGQVLKKAKQKKRLNISY